MKQLKYIVISVMFAMGMTSCEDFFDTKTPSAMDTQVYNSASMTEQVIASVYNEFATDRFYRNRLACGYMGLNTDIEYCTKSGNQGTWTKYAGTPVNSDISQSAGKDPWGLFSVNIERLNVAIDGIRTLSDLNKKEFQYYLGECLFLRAFIYLEQLKLWGDVPASFEPLDVTDPNAIYVEKVDRNIVFEQIRKDLKEAADLMPWSQECPGMAQNNICRPSKGSALGLLARANLLYAGKAIRPAQFIKGGCAETVVKYNVEDPAIRQELYKEAADACAQIINHDDAKFKPEFINIFKDLCEDKTSYSDTEYLWVMPFNDGSRGQFLNYNSPKSTGANGQLKNQKTGSTNSVQAVVPSFVFKYDPQDKRKWVTIAPFEWVQGTGDDYSNTAETCEKYFPESTASDKKLYPKKRTIEGLYLGKYRVEWLNRERGGNDDGVDFPIIRYTDVLLMYAEACAANIDGFTYDAGATVSPQACLDKVRTRAGLAPVTLTLEALQDERAFEFCGEYIRKWDLMRWGIWKEKMIATQAECVAMGDTYASKEIFYKLKLNDDLKDPKATVVHAYEFEEIYGLHASETEDKSALNTEEASVWWYSSNIFVSDSEGNLLKSYKLYNYENDYNENKLNERFFWPIFQNNLGSSNGSLWNDYGY